MNQIAIPTIYQAYVLKKDYLNDKYLELTIKLVNPNKINFIPGQFINIEVDESTFRSYSICSNLKDQTTITIVCSLVNDGHGVNYLKNLNENDQITFIGPSGKFILTSTNVNKLTFFATGTGIAPFLAYFYKLIDENYLGMIKLYWGMRDHNELFCEDKLEFFRSKLANFNYEIYLSKTSDAKKYEKGRITSEVTNNIFQDAHYYLCGNPYMIDEVKDILLDYRIKLINIFYEKFISSKEKIEK